VEHRCPIRSDQRRRPSLPLTFVSNGTVDAWGPTFGQFYNELLQLLESVLGVALEDGGLAVTLVRDSMSLPRGAGSAPSGGVFGSAGLEALARRCPERTLRAGECLFQEGTPLDCVYVVRRGLIGLGRRANGRRVTFLLLHPGDIVGDLAALFGCAAFFDAYAVTGARVLVVPAAEFLEALDLRSSFLRQWAIGLGGRISALQERLEEVLGGDLRSQIASLLHHELESGSRVVSLTQQAIADLLGVQRTSVTRTLQGLQRQGIIEIGYGHIAVRDHASLATAAGGTSSPERTGRWALHEGAPSARKSR
jgi:CRP-like cAMP-binding protein